MSAARLASSLAVAGAVLGAAVVAPAAAAAPGERGSQWIVRYSGVVDEARAERSAGVRRVDAVEGLDLAVVTGSRAAAVRLAAMRGVAYVEPDGLVRADATPNDTYWPQQWGPARVSAPAAWDVTTGSAAVTIAVLDSGVDAAQPDLSGRVVAGPDFVNDDADPADDNGHGTKAAGVAGATGGNGSGVAGMCWSCRVVAVKVADAGGTARWSDLAAGMQWAADSGAQILSISLSGAAGSRTLADAVKYVQRRGSLVVASAGNTGDTLQRYPAAYDGVMAVAASDKNDARYGWSTSGSWVDVAAPGCNVTTAPGGGFGDFCGTSSSTPLVAGAAALLVAKGSSPAAAGQALAATAVPVSYVAAGRIDVAAALGWAAPAGEGKSNGKGGGPKPR